MQAPSVPDKKTPRPSTGGGFRLLTIISSAVLFAAVFGWLACIQRTAGGAVEFHWQGSAWLWIATGIASPVYFWRQIWPGQDDSRAVSLSRVIKGWAVLLIPSLMWMAYPLRFISGQQLLNVSIGLAVAALVLTCGGWMVFRLIKGFAADEKTSATVTPVHTPK